MSIGGYMFEINEQKFCQSFYYQINTLEQQSYICETMTLFFLRVQHKDDDDDDDDICGVYDNGGGGGCDVGINVDNDVDDDITL